MIALKKGKRVPSDFREYYKYRTDVKYINTTPNKQIVVRKEKAVTNKFNSHISANIYASEI